MVPHILVPAPLNMVLSPPIWYFQVLSLGFFLFFLPSDLSQRTAHVFSNHCKISLVQVVA